MTQLLISFFVRVGPGWFGVLTGRSFLYLLDSAKEILLYVRMKGGQYDRRDKEDCEGAWIWFYHFR